MASQLRSRTSFFLMLWREGLWGKWIGALWATIGALLIWRDFCPALFFAGHTTARGPAQRRHNAGTACCPSGGVYRLGGISVPLFLCSRFSSHGRYCDQAHLQLLLDDSPCASASADLPPAGAVSFLLAAAQCKRVRFSSGLYRPQRYDTAHGHARNNT